MLVSKLMSQWQAHTTPEVDEGVDANQAGYDEDLDEMEEDVSEEIIADRLLRVVTRTYASVWESILWLYSEQKDSRRRPARNSAPLAETSASESPKRVFEHQELVTCLFSDGQIINTFVRSMSMLMSVNDTGACRKAIMKCRDLIPFLVKTPQFHPIVGKYFLESALEVLHNGYQKDNHHFAVWFVTDIYTELRPISDIPFTTMSSIPGMNIDYLKQFESEVMQLENPRDKFGKIRESLKAITGVEVSQQFAKTRTFILNASEKLMFMTAPNEKQSVDLLSKLDQDSILDAVFDK